MRKPNPIQWREALTGEVVTSGIVEWYSSDPGFILGIQIDGVYGVAGGQSGRFKSREPFELDFGDQPAPLIFDPGQNFTESKGEVFTNADRMQTESGAMLEVRKALHAFKVEQNQQLRKIREKRNAVAAREARLSRLEKDMTTTPEPVVPEPEPEPAPSE